MRLTSLTVTNLAAFKGTVTFPLHAVTILEAAHGKGKSSFEQCIMYAIGLRPLAQKGQKAIPHDPGILHGTCEEGSAVITFDDGPLEQLRVRVTADTTKRTVKVRGRKAWEDAGQMIYDITSALSYNPMALSDLEPKERIEAFLRVAAVEIGKQEVVDAVGGVIPATVPDAPGLDTLNALHDDIYRARTAQNTEADRLSKHAGELEKALPPAAESGDWNAEASRLRADKVTLEESEAEEIRRIGRELQGKRDGFAETRREDEGKIDKELTGQWSALDIKIEALERQINGLRQEKADQKQVALIKKNEVAQVEADAITEARAAANAEASELKTANAPLHAKLLTDIATADERSRSIAQAEGTRAAAARARREAEESKVLAKSMTEALERLTALKATAGGRMKVKGVTLASPRPGLPVDICREEDGALVALPRWNDADKDAFCLRMSVLFRGPCGIVCVDNMGNWSPERQLRVIQRCCELATENDMQFILGRATDSGDLKVINASEAGAS